MAAKKNTEEAKAESQTVDCSACEAELERVTQQLSELNQIVQTKDAEIAGLNETVESLQKQLQDCSGGDVALSRERDHAVNKANKLQEANTTLAESNERLVKENAELGNAVRAFNEAAKKVASAYEKRSSGVPASSGRTSAVRPKRPPQYLNGTVNPEWQAWKAAQGA